jgi:hypothetical protein
MTEFIKFFFLLLAAISFASVKNHRDFISPNRMTKAIVYNFPEKETTLESRIRIMNINGKVLFETSFTSKDGQHGFGVTQAQWTTDSRFFVFGMHSSGGHQPWHILTFAYSVKLNKLISIDKLVEPVISRFKLFSPDSIEAEGFKSDLDHPDKFGVRLSKLIHRHK